MSEKLRELLKPNYRKVTYNAMIVMQIINLVLLIAIVYPPEIFALVLVGSELMKAVVFTSQEDCIHTLELVLKSREKPTK